MRLSGTIKWPQVNLGSIMWPEKDALFSRDHAQETVLDTYSCGAAMIDAYTSMSVEHKARKFSFIGPDNRVVPSLKYTLWKHKVARAANLWVKLQKRITIIKNDEPWVRGAPTVRHLNYIKPLCSINNYCFFVT
jgi:hypothetical protein